MEKILICMALASSLTIVMICSTRKIPSAVLVKNLSIISMFSIILTFVYILTFIDNLNLTTLFFGTFGTFLIWLLFHSIIGIILVYKRTTTATLSIYFGLQSALIILILAILFDYTKVSTNFILPDNLIVIYSLIVIAGCSILAVPLSLSLGNLMITPTSNNFLKSARSWTLTSLLLLGAGFFIGTYWTYSILGIGNENHLKLQMSILSPILPCLLCAILLHLINFSKSRRIVSVSIYAVSIFVYSAILCGMFLVRVYINGGFAIHSSDNIVTIFTISIINAILLIAGFSLISKKSIRPLGEKFKFNFMNVGGLIVHFGVLMGLIALALSTKGEFITDKLIPGTTNEFFSHKIIYEGQVYLDDHLKNYVYTIDGETIRAIAKLNDEGEDIICEPAILRKFEGDVYIMPTFENIDVKELILQQEQFTVDGELGYIYQNVEYLMNSKDEPIGLIITITITDGDVVKTIDVTHKFTDNVSETVSFFDKRIKLTGISDDKILLRVEITPSLDKLAAMPVLTTVSIKPFMWLIWLSFILIMAGMTLSFINSF